VTASARRVAIVPTNGDDLAVASGSEDVTRRRLEIEQINVDISKTKSTYKKKLQETATKTSAGSHHHPNNFNSFLSSVLRSQLGRRL